MQQLLQQVHGSFTGIRIGIASIKAIAEVKNIKIISINSLEELAGNEEGNNDFICSLIDARNNQVYFVIFDSKLNKQEELMADDINVILEKISARSDKTYGYSGLFLLTLHKN